MKKLFLWAVLLAFFVGLSFAQELPPGIPRHETLIAQWLTGRAPNPGNFNIWATWVWNDRGIQNLLLEPLWCVEYATGEIINALAAEPPKYNADFTEVTFVLRKGVYWSDGVPFTADDVIYSIELAKKTQGFGYYSQMQQVKEVVKVDDYTVRIKLNAPNSRFHTYFLDRWGGFRPLPKHVFEKVEDPLTFTFDPPIGTGPYVLHSYDPGGYWILWVRREDWQRTPTGMLYGMPQPKYVLMVFHPTAEKRVLAMAQHQLDISDFSFEALRVVLGRVNTARAWRKNFPWVVNIDPCVTGLHLNNAVKPFDNPDVRWALVLAIDIVEYAINAFDGAVTVSPIHIPLTPAYYEWYFKKMEDWLKNFELDLGNGEKFKPYDPTVPFKLAEHAKKRGYPVPDDPEMIRKIFGPGWWKYAPDVAEKLLKKHGFTRGKDGKWRLPNGEVWKITINTGTNPVGPGERNAFAAAQAWSKFGIDVVAQPTELGGTLHPQGQFEVSTDWPAAEPWGGHPDLYRTLNPFHSRYLVPLGQNAPWGNYARWTNPAMDKIIEEIERTAWGDTKKLIDLGIEALKILVKEMPTIPTYTYPGVVAFDEYYWTNWPTAENMYAQPYPHWPNFKYMLPRLKPTGRK